MFCDGPVDPGVGCQKYAGSDDHDLDTTHEMFMRGGGLGFGVGYDAHNAMMAMHLQDAHGLSFEESDLILTSAPIHVGEST